MLTRAPTLSDQSKAALKGNTSSRARVSYRSSTNRATAVARVEPGWTIGGRAPVRRDARASDVSPESGALDAAGADDAAGAGAAAGGAPGPQAAAHARANQPARRRVAPGRMRARIAESPGCQAEMRVAGRVLDRPQHAVPD